MEPADVLKFVSEHPDVGAWRLVAAAARSHEDPAKLLALDLSDTPGSSRRARARLYLVRNLSFGHPSISAALLRCFDEADASTYAEPIRLRVRASHELAVLGAGGFVSGAQLTRLVFLVDSLDGIVDLEAKKLPFRDPVSLDAFVALAETLTTQAPTFWSLLGSRWSDVARQVAADATP